MSLYPNYAFGAPQQYTTAKEYFEHGGKILGLHKERDTNNGLNHLANAIQGDLAQLKMELAQVKRGGSPTTPTNPSPRLYLNG
jgi:hypothetical protein